METREASTAVSPFPPCAVSGRVSDCGKRMCLLIKENPKFVDADVCIACPFAGKPAREIPPEARQPRKRTARAAGSQQPKIVPDLSCVHRGEQISTVGCATCGGGTAQIPVFGCAIREDCTIDRVADKQTACCRTCKDRVSIRPKTWSYGVLTSPPAITSTLPATLASLAAAGFDKPTLFINGGTAEAFQQFGLPTFSRSHALQNGVWHFAALELYLRSPLADFYALFDDDASLRTGSRADFEKSSDSQPNKWMFTRDAFRDEISRMTEAIKQEATPAV